MPYQFDPNNPISDGQQRQVWNSNHPEEPVTLEGADWGVSATNPNQIAGGTHDSPSTSVSNVNGSGGDVGFNAGAADAATNAANAAAQQAYLRERLRQVEIPSMQQLDERERQRLAIEAAQQAWTQAYQMSQLSGYLPTAVPGAAPGVGGTAGAPIAGTYTTKNGQKTVAQMRAELQTAGYPQAGTADEATIAQVYGQTTGGPVAPATAPGAPGAPAGGGGLASRAQALWEATPPAQRTGERAAAIWQQIAPGLNPQEAQRIADAGRQYYITTGQVMPDDIANQHLSQITGGRVTGQTPTLEREREQNQTALQLLQLQASLRGPQDWLTYANTLQNVPGSIKQIINQVAGRYSLPTGAGAGAASVGDLVGDVTGGARGPGAGAAVQMFGQPGAGQTAPGPVNYMRAAQAAGPAAQTQSAVYPGAAPGSPVAGRATEQMPTYGQPMTHQPSTFYGGPAGGGALPLANQLPRELIAAGPTAQRMVTGAAGTLGQDPDQYWNDYLRSLPQYGGAGVRGVVRR